MFVFGGPIKEDVTTDIEDLEVLCGLACAHSLSPFAGTETGGEGGNRSSKTATNGRLF